MSGIRGGANPCRAGSQRHTGIDAVGAGGIGEGEELYGGSVMLKTDCAEEEARRELVKKPGDD